MIYPGLLLALALFGVIVFGGHYLSEYIVVPGSGSTRARHIASLMVGIPIGLTLLTLTGVAVAAGTFRTNPPAVQFLRTVVERSAIGAAYGTLLAIRALSEELAHTAIMAGEAPTWDVLTVISNGAGWGTLVGAGSAFWLVARILWNVARAHGLSFPFAAVVAGAPYVVALNWTIVITGALARGYGWPS